MNDLVTPALAIVSIAISAGAQFVLKAGLLACRQSESSGWLSIVANPLILSGFGLYGLGALVWLRVLSQWDVSKAYPMVGLGFVLTLLVGAWLGEQVSGLRVAGVILIVVGVLLINRS